MSGKITRRFVPSGGPDFFQPAVIADLDSNVGVIMVLKAASRSMIRGVIDGHQKRLVIGEDDLPGDLHIFIRDPLERLRSSYQFMMGRSNPISRACRGDYCDFVDDILLGDQKDPHWAPQSAVISMLDGAPHIHLFERLDGEYPLGPLQRLNSSKRMEIDDSYREQEVREFYSDDYALREGAA